MLLSAKAPPSWRDRLNAERPTPNIDRGNGEGGIRTLGSLLGYGALAKRCFQPLSHLTKCRARISPGIADCQHRPWSRARNFIGVANCRLLIEMIGNDQRARSPKDDSR